MQRTANNDACHYSPSLVSSSLATDCALLGFEICHDFDTRWYNAQIQQEGLLESGQLKCLPETTSSYLIGNTKSIWPHFCDWLVEQYGIYQQLQQSAKVHHPEESQDTVDHFLQDLKDPLDTFCEQELTRLFKTHFPDSCYDVFWDHAGGKKSESNNNIRGTTTTRQYWNSDFMVCMSRVAHVSGLCWNDQHATKLCIHPRFGTWHAYRAVLILREQQDEECDSNPIIRTIITPPTPPLSCPVLPEEMELALHQMQVALQLVVRGETSDDADGSGGSGSSSNNMMERAKSLLGNELHPPSPTSAARIHNNGNGRDDKDGPLLLPKVQVSPSLQAWMDLRDCISTGRNEYRYSEAQLLYHYTRDPKILKHEIEKRCDS